MLGFEEENKQGRNLVSAPPAKEEEVPSAECKAKVASTSASKRKRKGGVVFTPLNRNTARLYERRRRCGGGGVKLREPEEEKEEEEERKSTDDVGVVAEVKAGDGGEKSRNVVDVKNGEELPSDEEVTKINKILLSYLDQLPPEAIDSEFGY